MLLSPVDFHTFNIQTFNRSRLDTISKYFSTVNI